MSPPLHGLFARFDALNARERLLIVVGVAALIYGGIDRVGLTPLLAQQKSARDELAKLESSNAELAAKIAAVPRVAVVDPDEALRRRIKTLNESLETLDRNLQAESVNLIPPDDMSRVLEEFVAQQGDLRLVGLKSLGVVSLVAESETLAQLYKHGMSIEVIGSYEAISRYLKALEESKWRLYWDSIELKTENYPQITATLGVYTLSLSDNWLSL
jgi:MSHA biogenesis protein MshJ